MHSQNFQHFIPWQIHPGPLLSLHFGLISAHLFLFTQVMDANFQRLGKKVLPELKSLLITRKSEAMPNQIPLNANTFPSVIALNLSLHI